MLSAALYLYTEYFEMIITGTLLVCFAAIQQFIRLNTSRILSTQLGNHSEYHSLHSVMVIMIGKVTQTVQIVGTNTSCSLHSQAHRNICDATRQHSMLFLLHLTE